MMKVEVIEQKINTIDIEDGYYKIDPYRMIKVKGNTTISLFTCCKPSLNIYPKIKGKCTRRFFREMDAEKFKDLQRVSKEEFDSAMAQATYDLMDA